MRVLNHTVLFSLDCPTATVMFAKEPVNLLRDIRHFVVLLARNEPSTKPVNIEMAEVT